MLKSAEIGGGIDFGGIDFGGIVRVSHVKLFYSNLLTFDVICVNLKNIFKKIEIIVSGQFRARGHLRKKKIVLNS